MSFLSKIIYLISILALIHSAYSAYEFSRFTKRQPITSSLVNLDLPLDIKIEAVIGVLLSLSAAILESIGSLKPISFSLAMKELQSEGRNLYINLETRPVFQDIISKRNEFAKWTKEKNA